ncbi:MAG TPA: orotidine-5'-phosphate decarboxylase [Flavobacteriaceae bacterium]|nr:orotidine-5'-phosphate decarboxylase [Flavobacteriaceae bacterium]
MTLTELRNQIVEKRSFLCIGLDVDLEKIPASLHQEEDPIFAFNKAIIDNTHHLAVAYKPNTAFYEAYGLRGWKALQKTITYLKENHPEIFVIADAKRGDIGNTSTRYAKAFFEEFPCDAITIAPYMGRDSVEPFLEFKDKYAILLGLTSNPGSLDFQMQQVEEEALFEKVIRTALDWDNSQHLMFVIGATKPEYFQNVRKIAPNNFLLVPGVGAQGGELKEVCKYGLNEDCGLLINSSRGIIYASSKEDFAETAAEKAKSLQQEMETILEAKGFFE